MKILVCVKRVPAPGARINLRADARSIDDRHLSFTISPHEECAVEEAIRLRERHGGEITVLTVGPVEAEEQLRYAVSVGADRAELIATTEVDLDPQATARSLADRIATLEADQTFDLILVGNESADSGGYQVGIRLAHALGRPIITGIKAIEVEDSTVTARRESEGGFEVYRFKLPALVGVKEGINLPRYPTLPGRLKAKKADVGTIEALAPSGGLTMVRLAVPVEQETPTQILGSGASAAPAVVDVFEQLGLL